jgi:hypothetical protein
MFSHCHRLESYMTIVMYRLLMVLVIAKIKCWSFLATDWVLSEIAFQVQSGTMTTNWTVLVTSHPPLLTRQASIAAAGC